MTDFLTHVRKWCEASPCRTDNHWVACFHPPPHSLPGEPHCVIPPHSAAPSPAFLGAPPPHLPLRRSQIGPR